MGASDAKGSGQIGAGAGAYELVMATEEQIDFIQDELVSGNIDARVAALPPQLTPHAACRSAEHNAEEMMQIEMLSAGESSCAERALSAFCKSRLNVPGV